MKHQTPTPMRKPRTRTVRGAPTAVSANRRVPVFLATAIYSLLVARVIVPGLFDYGSDVDGYVVSPDAELISKISWLTAFGVSAALVLARLRAALRLLSAVNPFFLALLALAAASVLWSIDPIATVARSFRLLTVLLCCLAVVLTGWREQRFQEATRPIFTFMLLGSLIFGLIAPDLALDLPGPGETTRPWHGLADQKNQFGALASMGVILWFHGWVVREVRLTTALAGGCVAAACLALSRSSTNMMATALVCAFLLLLRASPAMRRRLPIVIGVFVAITLTYTIAVLGVIPGLDGLLAPVAALAGKDTTFSNRTQIWELVWDHIRLSPYLGTGYGAYWVGPVPTSPSYIFLQRLFFYPGECHSGYLEIINDLGCAGLMLLIGYLWTMLRQLLRLLQSNYGQAALYFAMLFQQLLTNLSESHWLFIQSDCLMLTLATLCIARHRLDRTARTIV